MIGGDPDLAAETAGVRAVVIDIDLAAAQIDRKSAVERHGQFGVLRRTRPSDRNDLGADGLADNIEGPVRTDLGDSPVRLIGDRNRVLERRAAIG